MMTYLPDKHELLADANEDFKWGKPGIKNNLF